MQHHFITRLITTAIMATAVISPIATIVSPTVSAHAVQSDGPWETDSGQHDVIARTHGNDHEIYYSVANHMKYQPYVKTAVAAWNRLGVIKLVPVPDGDAASEINFSYHNTASPNSSDGEIAQTQWVHSACTVDPQIANTDFSPVADITMYRDLNGLSKTTIEVAFEHELGHALGFAHDNRHLNNGPQYKHYSLTMNAYNGHHHTYRLGGIEQHTLADHYDITPNYWLNTNC